MRILCGDGEVSLKGLACPIQRTRLLQWEYMHADCRHDTGSHPREQVLTDNRFLQECLHKAQGNWETPKLCVKGRSVRHHRSSQGRASQILGEEPDSCLGS